MMLILQQDAPMSFGFYPYSSVAIQDWMGNSKPAILIRDHGLYLRLNADERSAKQGEWNRPLWWPLGLVAVLALLGFFFARKTLRRRERMNARGEVLA